MKKLAVSELSFYHAGRDAWGEWKKGFCEGAGFALVVAGFANFGTSSLIRLGMAGTGAAQYIAC